VDAEPICILVSIDGRKVIGSDNWNTMSMLKRTG